jgi:hypothetical protein
VSGPQQQRLAAHLAGADEDRVGTAAREWEYAASILDRLAADLLDRTSVVPEGMGAQTAEAVVTAFTRSATGMTAKAGELRDGAAALQASSDVIRAARTTHRNLGTGHGDRPQPLTFVGPMDKQDVKDDQARTTAIAAWDAEQERRERDAARAADHMDLTYAATSKTLRKIHGRTPPSGGQSPAGAGGGLASTPPAPAGHPATGSPTAGHPGHDVPAPSAGTGHASGSDGATDTAAPIAPASGPTGTPQGATGTTATTAAPASSVGGGPGPSPAPGLLGSSAVGVGIGTATLGVTAAATGNTGGLIGPRVTPSAASGNVRPIGATSQRGGSATLGRATPTTASGSTASRASSARTGGAKGTAAATAGTSGSRAISARSGSTGSAGRAGSRSQPFNQVSKSQAGRALSSPGHTGRSRKQQDRERAGREAEYLEAWDLDDDDTAPGLLD